MNKVQLGSSDLHVTPICLGTMTFGEQVDEKTSHAILDRSLARGVNFLDTAEMYSVPARAETCGSTENIIGNWFAKNPSVRGKVVLASKVAGPSRGMPWVREGSGMTAKDIVASCEASLKRLQTDVIDLYQIHWPERHVPAFGAVYYNPAQERSVTSIHEQLQALAGLVKAGKVRAIGASQYEPARLRESIAASGRLGIARYDTWQPEYNLHDRARFERELQPVALEHGLAVIPFFGLAKGFLSGKYRKASDIEGRPRAGGLKKYFESDRGMKILAALDAVCARVGATPAQVSLAWLMAQPSIAAPIVSVTSVAQLDEISGAAAVKLDREALAALDAASR